MGREAIGAEEYEGYEREYERELYGEEAADDDKSYFMGDEEKFKKMEEEIARKQVEQLKKKYNEKHEDARRWEETQLLISGVVMQRSVETEFEEDEEKRVSLLVHDIKPPFLDGRVAHTTQQTMVSAVRDPTSDLAVLARKGSQVVREQRELRDRMKSQDKHWDIHGKRIASAMGVKTTSSEEGEAQATREDGEVDYRASSRFADHMQEKSQAVSAFAMSKTIKQQREYLPIYQVHAHTARTHTRIRRGPPNPIYACADPRATDERHPGAQCDRDRGRDGFGQDDAAHAVPPRRWLHQVGPHRVHAAASCGRHVRRQACLRGNGHQAGRPGGLLHSIRGLHL